MANDKNGYPLSVGDVVTLKFQVAGLTSPCDMLAAPPGDYCCVLNPNARRDAAIVYQTLTCRIREVSSDTDLCLELLDVPQGKGDRLICCKSQAVVSSDQYLTRADFQRMSEPALIAFCQKSGVEVVQGASKAQIIQRLEDENLERADFNKMTLAHLIALAKERGVVATGSKEQIINALEDAFEPD